MVKPITLHHWSVVQGYWFIWQGYILMEVEWAKGTIFRQRSIYDNIEEDIVHCCACHLPVFASARACIPALWGE
jgi:hypothetical protein